MTGLVRRTGNDDCGNLLLGLLLDMRSNFNFDIRVNLLAQCPKWPFHAYRIVGRNRDGNAGGQDYR